MDIQRDLSPPANDKIVPNVYNVLDAHVVKRTSTFNNMLRYRLDSQEKVLTKHKRDAERFIVHEKARAVDSLNKIHSKLNAVSRIRDFDVKFFQNHTHDSNSTQMKKQKGYAREKNEDAICKRCYIHHLPLKKKFYKKDEDDTQKFNHKNFLVSKIEPTPLNVNPNQSYNDETDQSEQDRNQADDMSDHAQEAEMKAFKLPHHRLRRLSTTSFSFKEGGSKATSASTRGAIGWWMPTPQNQQFLWKDKSGREVDFNKGSTPRLASNEEWKDVVKNVCSSLYSNKRRKGVDLNKTL